MRILSLAVLGAVVGGCIIDTVPTPEDNKNSSGPPGPNGDGGAVPSTGLPLGGVFYTSYLGASAVLVAGTEGTVPPSVTVGLENARLHAVARRQAAADGSFAVSIDAEVGDDLVLQYWAGTVVAGGGTFVVRQGSTAAYAASGALATDFGSGGQASASVSPPDPSGIVTVAVGSASGLVPGITVVVVNTTGAATSAAVALDGSFVARLPGASGDQLVLFAVEPGASPAGGPSVTIGVP